VARARQRGSKVAAASCSRSAHAQRPLTLALRLQRVWQRGSALQGRLPQLREQARAVG